jgi:hypothetical protein
VRDLQRQARFGHEVLRNIHRVVFVLWAGSLWSLAWVTATLFYGQADRHVAGLLAARLFSIETYISLAVAVLTLWLPGRTKFVSVYLAVGLLALNEWVLKRVMTEAHLNGSAAGLSFGAWHGISAVLYLIACLAVLYLVWNDNFR